MHAHSVANVLTSSVRVSVQNRPSGKSLSVQTLVGRLSTHGRMRRREEEEEKEGEGEGPIIIASRHDEDGTYSKQVLVTSCTHVLSPDPSTLNSQLSPSLSLSDFLLSVFLDINPVDSAVDQRFKVLLLPVQVTYHAVSPMMCHVSVSLLPDHPTLSSRTQLTLLWGCLFWQRMCNCRSECPIQCMHAVCS